MALPATRAAREGRKLILALVVWLLGRERSAELHLTETEAVAQTVGRLRQLRKLFTTVRIQQVELLIAMRKVAEADSQQANLPFRITMLAKQFLKHGINVSVELGWLRERLCARVRFKSCISNG